VSKPLITMVVPYYRQPKMLAKQLTTWASYSADVRDAFRFIVVDDCSPESAHEILDLFALNHEPAPFALPCISLYRIDKDVPWNRGMARNLGTKEATTPWVLHVDTDHVLPPESAASLVQYLTPPHGVFGRCAWYRFERFRVGAADDTRKKDRADPAAKFVKIHPHIDSYVCRAEYFWKAGGYNEDFSGVLGGGSPFLKEMERVNGEPIVLPIPLHVYTRHAIHDSSENTLSRDPELFKRRKAEIMKARGTLRGHDPIRLPWHRVF
jgi:hypothetical protein